MRTSDFKELKVWKRAIEPAKEVYLLVRLLPQYENYALSDQMRRAAVSVSSNIAEGQGRDSKKEFLHFIHIARGSLCEIESQCYLAVELGYLKTSDI